MYELFGILPPEIGTPLAIFMVMSVVRFAFKIVYEVVNLGYVPPEMGAPKLNLDKFGLPKDYATYIWLLYKKRVEDESPNRRAFLGQGVPYFGFSMQYDEQ